MLPSLRCVNVCILALCLFPAAGAQDVPKGGAAGPLPDAVLFRFFFRSVEAREAAAAKNPNIPPRQFQQSMGLNDVEMSAVKEIAAGCNDQQKRFSEQAFPQAQALRAQSKLGPAAKADASRQRAELTAAYDKQIRDCVAQLRNAMGPQRFQRLATWVKLAIGPRIKPVPVPEELR